MRKAVRVRGQEIGFLAVHQPAGRRRKVGGDETILISWKYFHLPVFPLFQHGRQFPAPIAALPDSLKFQPAECNQTMKKGE